MRSPLTWKATRAPPRGSSPSSDWSGVMNSSYLSPAEERRQCQGARLTSTLAAMKTPTHANELKLHGFRTS